MICTFVKTQYNTLDRLNMASISSYQSFFTVAIFLGDAKNKHFCVCCCFSRTIDSEKDLLAQM